MKKLHSLTFYALITPVLTLGASSLLAQAAAGQEDRQEPSTQGAQSAQGQASQSAEQQRTQGQQGQGVQRGQGTANSPVVGQGTRAAGQPGAQSAADRMNAGQHERAEIRGFIGTAPVNGLYGSKLMGADVNTSGDEKLGSVSEIIIDDNGQIVAIVVGVGGFLGMGQRDVAIGWDDVTKSSSDADGDDLELRVNLTRESLRSAPEYKARD